MAPRYRVTLTVEERSEMRPRAGRADGPWPGWPRRWASRPARSSTRRFVEQGLEFALERKRRVRPPREVIFRPRLAWSPWPAPRPRQDGSALCWRRKWWNWAG